MTVQNLPLPFLEKYLNKTSIKWAELQWPIGLQQEPRSESAGINDRSIANASCTAIGPPPLKSRSSLQAQVSKTMKIRVPDRG
ncbi:hypothetical protein TNCV_1855812 [Trichonephila clavipes]|nr:hypothetical protein TNCV_1855812 [Trichonephila clavipes]